MIRTWRPWEKTRGPVTPEGKAKVSRNGYKGQVVLAEVFVHQIHPAGQLSDCIVQAPAVTLQVQQGGPLLEEVDERVKSRRELNTSACKAGPGICWVRRREPFESTPSYFAVDEGLL